MIPKKSIASSQASFAYISNYLLCACYRKTVEQSQIETEKIESLKKAINKLQEELTVQKTITDAVSERTLELKAEMEALTTGQSVLEKKVDEMTTLFQTTFTDLVKASTETFAAHVEKAETGKKEETPKGSEKAEEKEVDMTKQKSKV